mmetsp:Transcript_16677/g.28237  ORF Transcript_16677/g.28237 Transcript_16677/m.28237 type:complete len:92 (-) Transcript_16677:768-1043(-)
MVHAFCITLQVAAIYIILITTLSSLSLLSTTITEQSMVRARLRRGLRCGGQKHLAYSSSAAASRPPPAAAGAAAGEIPADHHPQYQRQYQG